MSPLERACRALCELEGNPPDEAFDGRPMWGRYLPQVKAVLDAMHEPSPRMTEAGAEIIRYVGPDESAFGHQAEAANVWRFMIDVAKQSGEWEPAANHR